MEGQDKDSPVPLEHKAQASAAPSFWDCPVQSQELDLILVVLSSSGYSGIFPPRAALSLLPTLLPSCCRNCCSRLAQEQRGNSQQLLLWRGASSCHSGQRDEAGLGLPFLIQEGYPHFRPFHALSSANSQSPVGRGAAAGASKQSPG